MADEISVVHMTGIIVDELRELTLAELSRSCAVHAECIIELVEEGVLVPAGREPRSWRFTGIHLRRATVALRLQQDLGINLAGVALALELLDELTELRARVAANTPD